MQSPLLKPWSTGWAIAIFGSILVHIILLGLFILVPFDHPAYSALAERLEKPIELPIPWDDEPQIKHPDEKLIHQEEESEAIAIRLIEEPVRMPIQHSILTETAQSKPPSSRPADSNNTNQRPRTDSQESSNLGEPSAPLAAKPTLEKSLVILIDCSLSMGLHDAFARARDEALKVLLYLPVGTPVQVIVFNRTRTALAGPGQSGLVPLDAGVFRQVRQRLLEGSPQGSTDHMMALRQAMAWKPSIILLMTDSDELSTDDIRGLSVLNAGKSQIDVIDFSWKAEREANSSLHRLTQFNRGSYRKAAARKS